MGDPAYSGSSGVKKWEHTESADWQDILSIRASGPLAPEAGQSQWMPLSTRPQQQYSAGETSLSPELTS